MQRFITKRTKRRLVRPFRNSNLVNKVKIQQKLTEEEKIAEKVKKNIKSGKKASKKKQENNTEKETDMNTEVNNVDKVKEVVENDPNLPKRKVKIEKRDKGLYERTEESTILITEDNKMMLTD